ncbi:MAG: EAL domain-containing protein, partial [Epsilonproteobacteria bacterium]|nr:EAL domain-containing protein [Campylobacterota bacterium]
EEENKKQKNLLMHQVEHDTLTGLPNRNLLQDRLTQAIKKASRDNKVLGVMFVDIDKFKNINDSLGHDAGDMLLKIIAARMRQNIRDTDTVARLSGDEFIVLLDGCKDMSDIFVAIKKLVYSFQEPFIFGNESFQITTSIGVSVYPHDGEAASKLLKNADIAMYKAKSKGRNRYVFFDQEMNQETNEHLEIEKNLRKALEREEFVIYYQPQINLQTERIVGLEALIRWNHPTRGLTTPNYFIHVAEESELIVEIGNWVIIEVMKQMKSWYDQGLNPGKTAINIAGKQLESSELISFLIQSLRQSGCRPEWLEMEIVERFIMKDTIKSIALLKRFRELGLDISIDDFGTGHSSLAYLKQLPITKLKIDQSFVQSLEESKEDRAIARTIIELGRGLGLKVLAEGVETKEQKEFIYASGCELMQGYLFSRPVCAEEIETMLKNQGRML